MNTKNQRALHWRFACRGARVRVPVRLGARRGLLVGQQLDSRAHAVLAVQPVAQVEERLLSGRQVEYLHVAEVPCWCKTAVVVAYGETLRVSGEDTHRCRRRGQPQGGVERHKQPMPGPP